MLLVSSTLPCLHGFSLRTGGASESPFASLNLSTKWGDDEAKVEENHQRLAAAGGFKREAMMVLDQVHGRDVIVVKEGMTRSDVAKLQADALVTRRDDVVLAVRTADCVPILIHSDAGAIAAVHAGWRGVVAGVLTATLDALAELNAPPEFLRAVIGPHICTKCFEVGDDVAQQFDKVAPSCVIREPHQKARVDLGAAAHLQLLEAGVSPAKIERVPACTMHEPDRFFSFRRDGNKTGLHLSYIAKAVR